MSGIDLSLTVHDTPAEIYDALRRVFDEHTGDRGSKWVMFTTNDVKVTFFAPRATS